MSPKGGKREGAGKPALYGKPMKRKEVMLPDEAIAFFVLLGEGNFSAGVQKAWRSLTQHALDTATPSDNAAALHNKKCGLRKGSA